jgi:hypothetical protein
MQIYSDWFDKVKLIHLDKHPDITNSENGPLFSAEFHLLYKQVYGRLHPYVLDTITAINPCKGQYNPSGEWIERDSRDAHFSHDNMTGLYCLYYLAFSRIPTALPLMTKYAKHPRDILFYLYAHSLEYKGLLMDFIRHLLLIIPSIAMIVSCFQLYKVRDGNRILKTDGKLLTWLRCKTFGLHKTLAACELAMRWRGKWRNWGTIFGIYFRRSDHPINQMASRLYHREF